MTHGSLYSGIGGWLLAARWAGIENIFTVETDEFCNKVLKKHFNVEQYKDIKEFNGKKYRGTIDILSTSDPCQPFSFAGKRGGTTDNRYLWPQTIRVIREIKPAYVVFENVPGFISMVFETVASDLEAEGYTVESFIIPACAIGAWHRRDRLWVIAYTIGERSRKISTYTESCNGWEKPDDIGQICSNSSNVAYSEGQQQRRNNGYNRCEGIFAGNNSKYITENGDKNWKGFGEEIKSCLCGINDGLSGRMDRLKSLGNSIVPQITYIIFEAIKEYEINSQDITHN